MILKRYYKTSIPPVVKGWWYFLYLGTAMNKMCYRTCEVLDRYRAEKNTTIIKSKKLQKYRTKVTNYNTAITKHHLNG